jgi:hypothetical protein
MATPEALVKAWARCATTARSSGEAPLTLLLGVLLLAVSEAWVAMCTPSLEIYFYFFQFHFFPDYYFLPGVAGGCLTMLRNTSIKYGLDAP